MMKKQFGLILLLVLFGTSSNFLFGQRGGGFGLGSGDFVPVIWPSVTINPTVTHATCFDQFGSIWYCIDVSTGWSRGTKINRLDLYDESWTLVESLTNNGSCGTISNLPVGMYNFYGSMTVQTSTGSLVSVSINFSVWVGIETVWTEKIDMVTSPNSYSAKRNASTVSYGGVRSSNGISSGDGWIEMSAVFGNTTDNRVFLMIGESNPIGTFDPNGNVQYIEFYKGSSGNGIRIKYQALNGSYPVSALSSNPDDKIRLLRNGASLFVQKNQSSTSISSLPVGYSGPMNIVVRMLAQDDGCLNVVSSFECEPVESNLYGHLKYKLDGYYHTMKNGHIKFVFDQEYDADDLIFNIYNKNDVLIKTEADFPALLTTNGDNYLQIDVANNGYCIGRGFFYLEVINSKKEKLYLRFFNDYSSSSCVDYIIDESND